MLITDSMDILLLVISISIAVLTGLLGYVLFYTGQTVKTVYLLSQEIHEKVVEISEMIEMIQDKVTNLSAITTDIFDIVKRVVAKRSK